MTYTKQKLKIIIILNNEKIPAWEFNFIEKLQNSTFAKITHIFISSINQKPDSSFPLKIYQKFDSKFNVNENALEQISINNIHPKSYKILKSNTLDEKITNQFSTDSPDIDLIISFSEQNFSEKVCAISKNGLWKLIHGKTPSKYPPGFFEIINEESIVESRIISYQKNLQTIISNSFSATDKFSVRRTMNSIYWKGISMLLKSIKHLSISKEFFSGNLNITESNSYENINLLSILKSLYKKYNDYKKFTNNYLEQWILMYNVEPSITFKFENFKKLIPKSGRIWADPFVIFSDNLHHVFYEDMSLEDNLGSISHVTIDENGVISEPKSILKKKYHISYPFIFEFDGTNYMIPESCANNKIDVYKCLDFPDKWEFHKTLINNIQGVDTTIFHHNNKWWMFTGILENKGMSSWDEVSLFYSDNPIESNWIPHPTNPIISDVRQARPAGKIFEFNGKLCRPSQDSSHGYGYGISINEIITINENEYSEKSITKLLPKWNENIFGLHTINHSNNLTLIDAKYRYRK